MRIPQILHKLLAYSPHFESKRLNGNIINTVAGPDLQIRGGGEGGGPPDPEISGGGRGRSQDFFSALRTSVWSKNMGGGGVPRALHSDPPLYKTDISLKRTLRVSPWHSSVFSFTLYRRINPSLKGGHLLLISTVSVLGTDDW